MPRRKFVSFGIMIQLLMLLEFFFLSEHQTL